VCAICASACSRDDTRLQQHKESFESLGATTAAVMRAWLDGDVSGTYAGAHLSQAAEKLSRLIAQMTDDVRGADAAAARMHLADVPIAPRDQP
jgi:hypothetical protein